MHFFFFFWTAWTKGCTNALLHQEEQKELNLLSLPQLNTRLVSMSFLVSSWQVNNLKAADWIAEVLYLSMICDIAHNCIISCIEAEAL
jgi:hypothetical protein